MPRAVRESERSRKMTLQFRTRNVASVSHFVSLEECRLLVNAMDSAPRAPAQVVRAGESILDESLRFCYDHEFPEAFKRPISLSLTTFFDTHRSDFGSDADYLYGPYFMSYVKRSF